MKKATIAFAVIAVLLSDIMCAVVAFAYRDMLYGIRNLGYSAPASVAFLYAIPFLAGIIICAVLQVCFIKNQGDRIKVKNKTRRLPHCHHRRRGALFYALMSIVTPDLKSMVK